MPPFSFKLFLKCRCCYRLRIPIHLVCLMIARPIDQLHRPTIRNSMQPYVPGTNYKIAKICFAVWLSCRYAYNMVQHNTEIHRHIKRQSAIECSHCDQAIKCSFLFIQLYFRVGSRVVLGCSQLFHDSVVTLSAHSAVSDVCVRGGGGKKVLTYIYMWVCQYRPLYYLPPPLGPEVSNCKERNHNDTEE